ncbi:PREDICTED: pseudouridylate synthase 7 homolog [Branchiostoma belcheri]|uniref:Pseudouridylate synthase 7 homolog n=1 Tax=Branchiostoma belcheri TaxID=7741 RepID=A0A6P4YSV7_BRABE|nr:PREDICTED: pseudouridylate synthase 7 homolog [Branchiostoma belcheri]
MADMEQEKRSLDSEPPEKSAKKIKLSEVSEDIPDKGEEQTATRETPETDELVGDDKQGNDASCEADTEEGSAVGTSVSAQKVPSRVNLLAQRETDVGITEYISKHEGFSGIIKQRYSDFLVREVDVQGKTVQLTDTSPPVDSGAQAAGSVDNVLSQEDKQKLENLLESKDKSATVDIEVGEDKEQRTRVHHAIKELFSELQSETLEVGDTKVIRVRYGKGSQARVQKRFKWPKGRPDYCQFVLYKENLDTMDAINLLAMKLRVRPGFFAYAGTKDKRAITVQEVTAYRIAAERFCDLNKQTRNVVIGNFRYTEQPLKLGLLSGNHFTIVLRNCTGRPEQIEAGMSSLRDNGFINYFGMQRFGTTSVPSHHVGRALLHSKWEEAIELILKPREGEHQEGAVSACRDYWWKTRDAKGALERMPKRNMSKDIEGHLLQGLVKNGKDLVGALSSIPRNTRMLYVHSYQSYIWNSVVSRRLQEYGFQPVVGDLVLQDRKDGDQRAEAKALTEGDLENCTIHDVVFPLFGYDVIYPQHKAEEWYREMLSVDQLDMDNIRHKVKDYSLSGAYRKIVMKPTNCKWSVMYYDDVKIPLMLTDKDILDGKEAPLAASEGKMKALKVEFTLPPSTYATMALREVLKTDTSSGHQALLNTQ